MAKKIVWSVVYTLGDSEIEKLGTKNFRLTHQGVQGSWPERFLSLKDAKEVAESLIQVRA